jgi:tetratricopeptide (TPR) repeat protein
LFVVALAWIGYSIVTVTGMPVHKLYTMGGVFYTLTNPIRYCEELYATVSNKMILPYYWRGFVGILGWLDTPLGFGLYISFGILLCCLATVSFQRNTTCLVTWRKVLLVCVTIASVFLLTNAVVCVQGRYFTPAVILLSYAIFDRRLSRIEFRLGLIIIFLMLCLSIAGMSPKLLERYWLSTEVQITPNLQTNSQIDFNADAYYNRGVTYCELGNYWQAIADFDRAIEINPKYAESYNGRGVATDKLGYHSLAISYFDRAIEINPKYAEAYKGRGVAYGKLGNYRQAISDFDRAIAINPDYAMAYYDRGVVYDILGDDRQAIPDFDRAIAINPEYAEAYNGRGFAHGKLGDHRLAISDFDRAIEINPKYAMAYYNRAVVYGILGNHSHEIEDLQKAASLDSQDAKK